MTEGIRRDEVLDCLNERWACYVSDFQQLPPEEQAAFLQRQGYARLADLLAHVLAWWEEGGKTIRRLVEDPGMESPRYEVDDFNAQAVQRFAETTEAEVIRHFEEVRRDMVALVSGLPDEAFSGKRINKRLRIEVCGHFEEHAIHHPSA